MSNLNTSESNNSLSRERDGAGGSTRIRRNESINSISKLIKNLQQRRQNASSKPRKDPVAEAEAKRKKRRYRAFFYFGLWVAWMLVGTLFYSYAKGNKFGLAVGFYQAVNIGYSIGYGYPREPEEQNWWFSSFYVIFGASLVAAALGFFADKIVESHDEWFMHLLQQEEFENEMKRNKNIFFRIRAWVKFNWDSLRAIVLWFIWVGIMIMYSMIQVGWPFSQAQYFAVSTCSTGGHMPIPDDSPAWLFGVTGFFAALGVPLMGTAMASLATLIMAGGGDLEEMKRTIEAVVTAEELLMLKEYGLEDGDGEIDRAEYIILCMVRTGTDPRLIQFISEHFNKLDVDGSGALDIEEITRGKHSYADLCELEASERYKEMRGSRDKLSGSTVETADEENQYGNPFIRKLPFEEEPPSFCEREEHAELDASQEHPSTQLAFQPSSSLPPPVTNTGSQASDPPTGPSTQEPSEVANSDEHITSGADSPTEPDESERPPRRVMSVPKLICDSALGPRLNEEFSDAKAQRRNSTMGASLSNPQLDQLDAGDVIDNRPFPLTPSNKNEESSSEDSFEDNIFF